MERREQKATLRKVPILGQLSEAELDGVMEACEKLEYDYKSKIIVEGEEAFDMFVLLRGGAAAFKDGVNEGGAILGMSRWAQRQTSRPPETASSCQSQTCCWGRNRDRCEGRSGRARSPDPGSQLARAARSRWISPPVVRQKQCVRLSRGFQSLVKRRECCGRLT